MKTMLLSPYWPGVDIAEVNITDRLRCHKIG
jgi:hypothetical protein